MPLCYLGIALPKIVQLFGGNSVANTYLRWISFVGLCIPCMWGVGFMGYWDRVSHHYAYVWGSLGVKEVPAISPFYKTTPPSSMRYVTGAVLVSGAVLLMFLATIVILELEYLVQSSPVCGSW